jgi:protein-S-isoprenylcysteine O-methyltransferase Ste14
MVSLGLRGYRSVVTLQTIGWIACVVYSTIPAFWLLIHPRAEGWRARQRSPYRILLPIWIAMWALVAAVTSPWRHILLYENRWTWIPACALFCAGIALYKLSHQQFSLAQLSGLPEVLRGHRQQHLVTTGIRSRVRHPVYLGHLCEMLAWSIGTALAVCWALTALAIVTGVVMIRMEDKELEKRFGEEYRQYRSTVPAMLPKMTT